MSEFSKALDENKENRMLLCDISRALVRLDKGILFKLRSIGTSEKKSAGLKIMGRLHDKSLR